MQFDIVSRTTIPVLEEVTKFSEARNAILASNVANLDTPGYRVRDLSVDTFQQRLREAIEARTSANHPTSPGILTESPDEAMRKVDDSMRTILFHDKSDVGLEQQVLELSKNQFMHNLAVTIMSHQFHLLQAAVGERV